MDDFLKVTGFDPLTVVQVTGVTTLDNSSVEALIASAIAQSGGGGGGASIDDVNVGTSTAYSSSKTLATIGALTAANVGAVPTAAVGVASGVASLDSSGLIPAAQLPALAIGHTYVVASQAAMLALSANVGDIAQRTDLNPVATYILQSLPASTLGNWILLATAGTQGPAGPAGPPGANGSAGTLSANLGLLAVDSFTGTDFSRWQQAMSAAGAATYPPTIVFGNRSYDLKTGGSPLPPFNGMSIKGPFASGREFRENVRIKTPTGGLFSALPGVKNIDIQDCSFELTDWFIAPFSVTGSAGHMDDIMIRDCGFQGAQVLSGTYTRLTLGRMYVNGATQTPFDINVTDSWLWCDGHSFISGTIPAGSAFVRLRSASMTRVGQAYITAQQGFGVQVDFSNGGLVMDGTRCDDWSRTGTLATQQAGLKILGGHGVTVLDWHSNNVNASGTDKADVLVTGGDSHILVRPQFWKTFNGQTGVRTTGPAVYCSVATKIVDPRAMGGYPKTLRQSAAGLITCNDSSWTITTAP